MRISQAEVCLDGGIRTSMGRMLQEGNRTTRQEWLRGEMRTSNIRALQRETQLLRARGTSKRGSGPQGEKDFKVNGTSRRESRHRGERGFEKGIRTSKSRKSWRGNQDLKSKSYLDVEIRTSRTKGLKGENQDLAYKWHLEEGIRTSRANVIWTPRGRESAPLRVNIKQVPRVKESVPSRI